MEKLTVAQLPLIAFLAADLSLPQPCDIDQKYDQQHGEKFCKTYSDHFPPPLSTQLTV